MNERTKRMLKNWQRTKTKGEKISIEVDSIMAQKAQKGNMQHKSPKEIKVPLDSQII